MDKQTFQHSMAYLAAAYSKEITTEQAAVYWDQLGSLDGMLFQEAVKAFVGHNRRFPTVAELRVHYRDAMRNHGQSNIPVLPVIRSADREKVRLILRGLRERMRL